MEFKVLKIRYGFELEILTEAYLERFKSNNSERNLIAQPSR
jgi:hypothetical protein